MDEYIQVCAEQDDIHTPVHPQEGNDDCCEAAIGRKAAALEDIQRKKPCEQEPRTCGGGSTGDELCKAQLHAGGTDIYCKKDGREQEKNYNKTQLYKQLQSRGDAGHFGA